MSFRTGYVRWHALLLAGLALLYLLPYPFSSFNIDTARDLYQAWAISEGLTFPSAGPAINQSHFLGPVWFYLLSLSFVVFGDSITAAALFVGLLSSLKYLLAYRCGILLRDARLGLYWAVGMAIPGVATYEQMAFLHTNLVATTVLLVSWCALHYWRSGRPLWLMGSGVALACAIHAHPTTAWVLMAPVAAWLARRSSGRNGLMMLLAALFLPSLLFMLPAWLGRAEVQDSGALSLSSGMFAAIQQFHGGEALHILESLVWGLPIMAGDLPAIGGSQGSIWRWGMALIYAPVVLGWLNVRQWRGTPGRLLAVTALGTGILAALIASVREFTPYYMAATLAPSLGLLYALGLTNLRGNGIRWGDWLARGLSGLSLILAVLAHGLVSVFLAWHAWGGWFTTSLGNQFDMKKLSPGPPATIHTYPAVTRDQVGRFLCGSGELVMLHGPLAAMVDLGGGMELHARCPERAQSVRLLGGENSRPSSSHWVGYPSRVWRIMGRQPTHKLANYGLARPVRIIHPAASQPMARGDVYPPHAFQRGPSSVLEFQFSAPRDAVVQIANPLYWFAPSETLLVTADGITPAPLLKADDFALFHCRSCPGDEVNWHFRIRAVNPDVLDIVLI